MIEVDISNIWGELSLPELLGLEKAVFDAHMALTEENHPLLALPGVRDGELAAQWAEEIRESSQVLVVLGGDGFGEGAVQWLGTEKDLRLIFVPGSFSSRSRKQLLEQLEGKSFSLCLCGGEHFWDSLLLRDLKWILERRYGTDEALSRIHRDSFGLIAMAAGGLDLGKLLAGMEKARAELDLRAYENPAWLYSASRYLLGRKGRCAERLICAEPDFAGIAQWWKRLFDAGSPAPVPVLLPCGGMTGAMDTLLRFAPGEPSAAITETATDPDGLNFLAGRTLADLEETAWDTLLNGNLDGDVPTVSLDGAVADEAALGWLYGFFRLSAALWEKLSGNTEENREEALLRALGKPQC